MRLDAIGYSSITYQAKLKEIYMYVKNLYTILEFIFLT